MLIGVFLVFRFSLVNYNVRKGLLEAGMGSFVKLWLAFRQCCVDRWKNRYLRPTFSATRFHKGDAAKPAPKVFHQEIDFASFAHIQSYNLQTKAYGCNGEKLKQDLEKAHV